MPLEPTITGNKLTWRWTATGIQYEASLTGAPVTVPGPPTTTPPPTQPPTAGVWLSRAEIERLPMEGAAWNAVLEAANGGAVTPNLSDQNSSGNVTVLAQALVYVRTNAPIYKDKVLSAVRSIINVQSENGGRTLALGRELAAYIVAADLISLEPAMKQVFSARLRELLTKTLNGMTLIECHERRPNNWGTHAGASRAAVAAYLGDRAELDRTAQVFKGWLGDRSSFAGFKFGGLEWQPDPKNPVAVGLPGATGHGMSLDGALPEELRREGGYNNYVWGALSGAVAQAMFLHRAGYPAFEWMERAILRAVKWPHDLGHQATGDDAWLIPVVNKIYGTSSPATGHTPGKNMGWTTWTHA